MPFKSEAQRKKLEQLVAEGKKPQSLVDRMSAGTGASLPPKVGTPKKVGETQYSRSMRRDREY